MHKTYMWDGRIDSSSLNRSFAQQLLELFTYARSGQWAQVLARLSDSEFEELPYSIEPDSPILNTILHYAALLNADPTVVHQLAERGAWRTRRNANRQMPLDMAREHNHIALYEALKPVLKMSVPSETLQALEQHFHDLLCTHEDSGHFVTEQALVLPQLEPLLEIDSAAMFFLVPGMFGGFHYCLRHRNDEIVLFACASSRMDDVSTVYRLATSGYTLIAKGRDAYDEFFKEEINHSRPQKD
jgi:hypothetical protein